VTVPAPDPDARRSHARLLEAETLEEKDLCELVGLPPGRSTPMAAE